MLKYGRIDPRELGALNKSYANSKPDVFSLAHNSRRVHRNSILFSFYSLRKTLRKSIDIFAVRTGVEEHCNEKTKHVYFYEPPCSRNDIRKYFGPSQGIPPTRVRPCAVIRSGLFVTLHRTSHLALDLCARGCTRFPRERAAFTAVDDDERAGGSRVRGVSAERQEEEWRGAKGGRRRQGE